MAFPVFHPSPKDFMLHLQDVSYIHPNGDLLFTHLDLSIDRHAKLALIGNNGAGKSTLLRLLAGAIPPTSGTIRRDAPSYYVPQLSSDFDSSTVIEALRVSDKFNALHAILNGEVTEANLAILNEDWTIEERCRAALDHWGLNDVHLDQHMDSLSGGQRTKVFLAGITVHEPEILLLDEPSNHLDAAGRQLLYELIRSYTGTLIAVSHDRKLLDLLDPILELSPSGIKTYGGNYSFYVEQRTIERAAVAQDVGSAEKALRNARRIARETAERQQRLDARGKRKQEKAGLPTIAMKTLRNTAEKSTARTKGVHAEKVGALRQELQQLREGLPDLDQMKLGFGASALHAGKILIDALHVNVRYDDQEIWSTGLSFTIRSGERIALNGANGSGKTTLMKLMLGELEPASGTIQRAEARAVYIDQEYSLIDNSLTVLEQAQRNSSPALAEHEVKTRLDRFLFPLADWDKPCSALSGGERMRLMLCCLTLQDHAPDLLFLDEPTNNLDIQNMEILSAALEAYTGTLIVVSHDVVFLEQIGVEREIGVG